MAPLLEKCRSQSPPRTSLKNASRSSGARVAPLLPPLKPTQLGAPLRGLTNQAAACTKAAKLLEASLLKCRRVRNSEAHAERRRPGTAGHLKCRAAWSPVPAGEAPRLSWDSAESITEGFCENKKASCAGLVASAEMSEGRPSCADCPCYAGPSPVQTHGMPQCSSLGGGIGTVCWHSLRQP